MVKVERTTPNRSQRDATGWPNARNMLRYVALTCRERLAGALYIELTVGRKHSVNFRNNNNNNLYLPSNITNTNTIINNIGKYLEGTGT